MNEGVGWRAAGLDWGPATARNEHTDTQAGYTDGQGFRAGHGVATQLPAAAAAGQLAGWQGKARDLANARQGAAPQGELRRGERRGEQQRIASRLQGADQGGAKRQRVRTVGGAYACAWGACCRVGSDRARIAGGRHAGQRHDRDKDKGGAGGVIPFLKRGHQKRIRPSFVGRGKTLGVAHGAVPPCAHARQR